MTPSVVLDIETVPTEAAMAAPYSEAERTPPGNMSKPETIAKWRENDRVEWETARIKQFSLSPRQGRILCLGMSLPCSDGPIYAGHVAETEDKEASLLKTFWDVMEHHNGRIVTFNGRTFDLPFLVLRSLHHGITHKLSSDTLRLWFARYRVTPHCDVRGVLSNWNDFSDGTLTDWCRFVGVPCTDGVSGADIYQLYRQGEYAAIAAKCKADVVATRQLYEKIAPLYCAEAA